MKTFRDSLLALCCLAHSLSAQSSPSTGLMTTTEYLQQSSLQDIAFANRTKLNHKNVKIPVSLWFSLTGEDLPAEKYEVSPEEGEQYIKKLFLQKGLLEDIKKLPHWSKNLTSWDEILNTNKIVIKSSPPENRALASISNMRPEKKEQLLEIYFNSSFEEILSGFASTKRPVENQLQAVLAHEMGHVYVNANYDYLGNYIESEDELAKNAATLIEYTAHESFAVYTQYRYLRMLAKEKIIAPLDLISFIESAYKDTAKTNILRYGISPQYMLHFCRALDRTTLTVNNDDIDIGYNFSFLNKANTDLREIKEKGAFDYKNLKNYQYEIILENSSNSQSDISSKRSILIDYGGLVESYLDNDESWIFLQVPQGNAVNGSLLHPWAALKVTEKELSWQTAERIESIKNSLKEIDKNFSLPWKSDDKKKTLTEELKNKRKDIRAFMIANILNYLSREASKNK